MLNGVNPETKASIRKANNSLSYSSVINTRKSSALHSKHLTSPSGRLIASEQELQLANDWLYYITLYALNENLSPQSQVSTQIKPPTMAIATRKDIPRKSRTEMEDFHFKDAVNTYQQLEKEEIFCRNCQQQSKKVNSFGYHDGFICMNCAAKAYTRISELVDWEEIVENGRGIQCDRLRHQKKLSSFIKFENKTGTYKRVKLCIFCRNVKRWEYSRKSLCPATKNSHSPPPPTTTTIANLSNISINNNPINSSYNFNSLMNNNNNNNNINSNTTINNININSSMSISSNSININSNISNNLISPKRRKVDELIPILPRPPIPPIPSQTIPQAQSLHQQQQSIDNNNNIPIPTPSIDIISNNNNNNILNNIQQQIQQQQIQQQQKLQQQIQQQSSIPSIHITPSIPPPMPQQPIQQSPLLQNIQSQQQQQVLLSNKDDDDDNKQQ